MLLLVPTRAECAALSLGLFPCMYMCVVLVIMIAVYGLKGGREEEEAYCRVLVVADGCGGRKEKGAPRTTY